MSASDFDPSVVTINMPTKTVRRSEFLTDPGLWLRHARKHGTIAIVDENGFVCARLSRPAPR